MREIKFRAWDIEEKKDYEVLAIRWDITEGMQIALPLLENASGLRWLHISYVKLREFTGLKDKNGKEIYEGDIIKDRYGRIMQVTFKYGCYCCENKSLDKWIFETELVEVIGNIYENPELLKPFDKKTKEKGK